MFRKYPVPGITTGIPVDLGSHDISAHRSHAVDGALWVQLRSLAPGCQGASSILPSVSTHMFPSLSQSTRMKNTTSCPCSFQIQKEFLSPILEFILEFSFIAKYQSGFLHPRLRPFASVGLSESFYIIPTT